MPPATKKRAVDEAEGYGASHTSIYTEAVAKESYETLDEVLATRSADPQLTALIVELLAACAKITAALRDNLVTVNPSQDSAFGDVQLTVDVIADKIMFTACDESKGLVYQGASEEAPELKDINPNGKYILCWDPLDGSSIVDNNWAVGTIIGVWDRKTGLIGATGRDQVCSIVANYGPRTTAFVTLDDGVYEFTLTTGSGWICSRERIVIKPDSKIFSPANMRAAQDLEGYAALIQHWMVNRYTLRYTGGLVPDVCQQFTKGFGVFSNPTTLKAPAKLRLAFEAAPFAKLVAMAGGKDSDGSTGGSVLDTVITGIDQRTPLCIGSANEVDRFNAMVLGK